MCGHRAYFLSHGPSVAALGRGETAGARFSDSGCAFYNPALLAVISGPAAGCSYFPLEDGSQYNFASLLLPVSRAYRIGYSVVNLRSGNIELRQNINDSPQIATSMQTASLLSIAARPSFLHGVSLGMNLKYIDNDLAVKRAAATGIDAGIAGKFTWPPAVPGTEVSLGASISNAIEPTFTLAQVAERYPRMYRCSAAVCMPTMYRLTGSDSVAAYADLLSGDGSTTLFTGVEYAFLNRFCVRGGYYDEHYTLGAGGRFASLQIDYAADFSSFSQLHRFGLTWYWEPSKHGSLNDRALMDEARRQMNAARKLDRARNRAVRPLYKAAMKEYRNGRFLNATALFSDIILRYPEYEAARLYHGRIAHEMAATAEQNDSSADLEEVSYARGFIAYQGQKYPDALTEWDKTLQMNPNRTELNSYISSVRKRLDDQKRQAKEFQFDRTAAAMYGDGIARGAERKWVASIKQMESLIAFCSGNDFPEALRWTTRAREHISLMLKELCRTMAPQKKPMNDERLNAPDPESIDAAGADKRYNEGLVLYAQGKRADAARLWEIALRLDPDHAKARKALDKVREELSKP